MQHLSVSGWAVGLLHQTGHGDQRVPAGQHRAVGPDLGQHHRDDVEGEVERQEEQGEVGCHHSCQHTNHNQQTAT